MAQRTVWIAASDERFLRWDGSTFVDLPVAPTKSVDVRTALWASGPSDVWLAGSPFARFDGASWGLLPGTDFGAHAIAGFGLHDVWLAGDDTTGNAFRHWDTRPSRRP